MKTVNWTGRSQHDTNIVAKGFDSLQGAKNAVDAFCINESKEMGQGNYPQKIVAGDGFEYDDDLGSYYFGTNCISA